MRNIKTQLLTSTLIFVLGLCFASSAYAHLLVAQHGTLNFVDNGAFMVLSLPVSAFDGIDDDNDGYVSMIEFNNHRAAIVKSIQQNILLSDKNGNRALEEILLSPEAAHDAPSESLAQITVMGRFNLSNSESDLRFSMQLFGKQAAEQSMKITATRNSQNQKQVFQLTPVSASSALFPK